MSVPAALILAVGLVFATMVHGVYSRYSFAVAPGSAVLIYDQKDGSATACSADGCITYGPTGLRMRHESQTVDVP